MKITNTFLKYALSHTQYGYDRLLDLYSSLRVSYIQTLETEQLTADTNHTDV